MIKRSGGVKKEVYKLRLAEISKEIVGAPYKLGGKSKEEGFDCLSMIFFFVDKWGISIPESFEGVTRDNYVEFWNKDQHEAREKLVKFLAYLGKKIKPDRVRSGDFVLCTARDQTLTGIYLGQGKILCIFDDAGVKIITTNIVKISRGYRWRQDG